MENILIKATNISKSFQTEQSSVEVLKNINLQIAVNDKIIIYGASGAGKSTFLNILSGLDSPNQGKVEYSGINLFDKSDEEIAEFRNQNIGFVFQFHHLLPEFTAEENVAIPLMIKGINKNKSLKIASEFLEKVNLKNRVKHKPAELSGGEQQRVAIARALVNNPKILFADEPTGNLDSENSKIIQNLLLKLHEEMNLTLVVVTHNTDLAKIGNRILKMEDGKIIEN